MATESRSAGRGGMALPCGVALACALVIVAPALSPDRALLGRDLPHLFYPLGKIVASATRRYAPLQHRDPTRGLGMPLVPDMLAESFYPPRLIRAVLPYGLGFKVWIMLHLALVGAGAGAVARALGATAGGAALAAAVGTTCGPTVSAHVNPNLLAGTGWCALALAALLAAEGRVGRRRFASVAGAAVAVGLALLAGGVEIVLGLTLAIAALVLFGGAAGAPGRAARGALAVGLGGALAAVQLVPSWLYVATTERAGSIERADALAWSMHPARLLGVVAPALFRLDALFWSELFEANTYREPLLWSAYMSVPLVVLAALAVPYDRRTRAVAGAVVVLIVAAFGRFGAPGGLPSLMDGLRHVPPYDRFRYPEKLFLVAAPVLAGLGGAGLTRLMRDRLRRFVLGLVACSVACLLVALIAREAPGLVPLDATVQLPVRTAIARVVARAFAHAGLLGIAAAGAAAIAGRRQHPRLGLVAALIGAGMVIDLLMDARGQVVIGRSAWLDTPPATARAVLERSGGALPPRVLYGPGTLSWRLSDLPETPGEHRLTVALGHREPLLGGYAGLYGLEQAWTYGPFVPRRLHALFLLGSERPDRLAYLAAIGAVTLLPGSRFASDWPRDRLPGTGFVVARAPAGPRARFVVGAHAASDLATARTLISSDAYDPRRETVVEDVAAPRPGQDAVLPEARIVSRDADRIEVSLEPPPGIPGVLVLSELFLEDGWTATVDGAPARVLPADVALVSVVVPAGARSAVFRAHTPGLGLGAALSACAAFAIVGLVAFAARR